jgi:hypothetical protein
MKDRTPRHRIDPARASTVPCTIQLYKLVPPYGAMLGIVTHRYASESALHIYGSADLIRWMFHRSTTFCSVACLARHSTKECDDAGDIVHRIAEFHRFEWSLHKPHMAPSRMRLDEFEPLNPPLCNSKIWPQVQTIDDYSHKHR